MPKDKISKLKAALAKLVAAHKTETKDFKKVAKAHKAEGKKVNAKKLGKTGRAKLASLHEAETDALEHLLGAHMDEGAAISSVRRAAPRPRAKGDAHGPRKTKGKPVDVMRSAEAKPAEPAAEKKPRGRPRTKLIPTVEPGMIPAALAGGAPETGPAEVAAPKPKRAYKRKTARDVFMSAADAALAAVMPPKEKKAKGRSKRAVAPYRSDIALLEEAVGGEQPAPAKAKKERKPRAKKGTVAGLEKAVAKLAKQTKAAEELVIRAPPLPASAAAEAPKEKKARKKRAPLSPEAAAKRNAALAKGREVRKANLAAKKAKKEKKED